MYMYLLYFTNTHTTHTFILLLKILEALLHLPLSHGLGAAVGVVRHPVAVHLCPTHFLQDSRAPNFGSCLAITVHTDRTTSRRLLE